MIKGLCFALGILTMLCVLGCPPMPPIDGDGNGDGDGQDIMAGQEIYDSQCAACHVLGDYDTAGFAPNLVGRQDAITEAFVEAHVGTTLTQAEVLNLRAFIVSQ